jgi:hypothetical protein
MDRLLVGSFLGGSVVVSFLLVNAWDALRNRAEHGRGRRFGYLLVVGYLVFWNFIASPVIIGLQMIGREGGAKRTIEAVLNAELPEEDSAEQDVVILHAPGRAGQMVVWSFQAIRDYLDKPVYLSWRVLTIAPCDHSLERIDSHSLELTCLNGKMLTTMWEQVFRSPSLTFRAGDVVEAGVMTAEVLETSEDYPTKVRFRFAEVLDSPRFLFLHWKDGTLRRAGVPEIGETRIYRNEEPGFWEGKIGPFLKQVFPKSS